MYIDKLETNLISHFDNEIDNTGDSEEIWKTIDFLI